MVTTKLQKFRKVHRQSVTGQGARRSPRNASTRRWATTHHWIRTSTAIAEQREYGTPVYGIREDSGEGKSQITNARTRHACRTALLRQQACMAVACGAAAPGILPWVRRRHSLSRRRRRAGWACLARDIERRRSSYECCYLVVFFITYLIPNWRMDDDGVFDSVYFLEALSLNLKIFCMNDR